MALSVSQDWLEKLVCRERVHPDQSDRPGHVETLGQSELQDRLDLQDPRAEQDYLEPLDP